MARQVKIGDRVAIPPQKSSTFPGLIYPARQGTIRAFCEDSNYVEVLLDDGTHIISAPVSELLISMGK